MSYPFAPGAQKAPGMYFATPTSDPVQYRTRCIPPFLDGSRGPTDWSLKHLEEPAFQLTLADELRNNLDGVNYFLAPTVSHMSGLVLPAFAFGRHFRLTSRGPVIARPQLEERADGVAIGPGQGFIMSAGGCPVIILTTPYGHCIVAHAGLKSLIDHFELYQEGEARPFASIIDAMMDEVMRDGVHPSEMTLRAFYAIPWQAYQFPSNDPEHGLRNQALHRHLEGLGLRSAVVTRDGIERICLNTLIWHQARKAGIGNIYVSRTLPLNGKFPYTRHENPELRGCVRYLVTVTRSPEKRASE